MKTLFLALLIAMSFFTNSQDKKPLIYNYHSGTYVDLDGEIHNGLIYFADLNSTTFNFKESVRDAKTKRLLTKDVKSFTRYKSTYIPINGVFYKKLNTENTIQLYNTYYKHPKVRDLGYFKYYVSIDGILDLTYFWDKSIKDFRKKVAPLLSNCPELSLKITNKTEGYIYIKGQLNLDLWRRVATEYETCRAK